MTLSVMTGPVRTHRVIPEGSGSSPSKMLLWYWGRRGGGAHYFLELAKAISRKKEVELHLSVSKQCDLYTEIKELGLPGFDVDTYQDAVSALTASTKLLKTRWTFGRYLRDNGIETVLCTMQHLWNPFMLPAIRRAGARYIVTVHDASLHLGEQIALYQWWLDWEIRQADGYVVLSDAVGCRLQSRHRLSPERIVVAPCGPYSRFHIDRHCVGQIGQTPRRLLFFGRIVAYKGLDLLLDAYRKLKSSYPDLSLMICGSGDLSLYEAKLRELADVTVDNRYIPEAEVKSILAGADLVVLPYREASQSGVMLVAEAAGVPVVGTPEGGLTEQIVPGSNGLIARSASAEALAAEIALFLDNPGLYRDCLRGIGRNKDARWAEAADRIQAFLRAEPTLQRVA